MIILLWIFLILLAILLIILLAPIIYQIEGEYGQQKDIYVKVSALLWLLRITYKESELTIKIGPYTVPLDKLQGMAKPKEKKESQFSFSEFKTLLTKLDINSIISLGIMLLKKLVKRIMPKFFNVRGTVGFDDPCTTGQFIGLYEAVAGATGLREAIKLQGDFSQASFEMDFKIKGYFSVASLLVPVIWFIIQKPVRDAMRLMKERAIT